MENSDSLDTPVENIPTGLGKLVHLAFYKDKFKPIAKFINDHIDIIHALEGTTLTIGSIILLYKFYIDIKNKQPEEDDDFHDDGRFDLKAFQIEMEQELQKEQDFYRNSAKIGFYIKVVEKDEIPADLDLTILKKRNLIRRIVNFWWIPLLDTHFNFLTPKEKRRVETVQIYRDIGVQRLENKLTPVAYLGSEADVDDLEFEDDPNHIIPNEIINLIQALRSLGDFELSSFSSFWQSGEMINVPKDELLFKQGDPDNDLYMVHNGKIQLGKTDENGNYTVLREITTGEQIYCLCSFIEALGSKKDTLKLLEARALEDTNVLRIPFENFRVYWKSHKEKMKNFILRLLRKIYHLLFVIMGQVLGINQELIAESNRKSTLKDNKSLNSYDTVAHLRNREEEEAIITLLDFLGINNNVVNNTILGDSELLYFAKQTVLLDYNSKADRMFYIIKGELKFVKKLQMDTMIKEETFFYAGEGKIVGAFAFIFDEFSLFKIIAQPETVVITLTELGAKRILKIHPEVILPIANSQIELLSQFSRELTICMGWMSVNTGKVIFKRGEPSEASYYVLTGRLVSHTSSHTKTKTVVEYISGEWLGLTESILTTGIRTRTCVAIRDTELAKFPNPLFEYLKKKFPIVALRLLDFLGSRVSKGYKFDEALQFSLHQGILADVSDQKPCSTIAIVPLSDRVPVRDFLQQFSYYFAPYGSIFILTYDKILQKLGTKEDLNKNNEGLVASWLSRLEDQYSLVIYLTEKGKHRWNLKCIRQADTIFLLAKPEDSHEITDLEKLIPKYVPLGRVELILIHRAIRNRKYNHKTRMKNTRYWLEHRNWVSMHHHVELDLIEEKDKNNPEFAHRKFVNNTGLPDRRTDLSRLARWISKNSVGLVLGGGGAKGAAEIGLIKSIIEKDIPIDLVCGVSMGAYVGALFCLHYDIEKVTEECAECFQSMNEWWRYFLDITFPYTSIFKGESFNFILRNSFEEIQIEDLRIPFFCVSTDLQDKVPKMHRFGTLWRYVRASMTVAVFFPPIIDPADGHYLMDGGYTNLVPANMMRNFGAKYILACDIAAANTPYSSDYGVTLSGFQVIYQWLNPNKEIIDVPNILKIHEKIRFVQSNVHLSLMKKIDTATIYLRPPIDEFSSQDFDRFDDLLKIGYSAGNRLLSGIHQNDPLDLIWFHIKNTNLVKMYNESFKVMNLRVLKKK